LRLPFKVLLAAPVVFLLYFHGLTRVGLLGPDEPRYAAIGRDMARTGDWITPRLWGVEWFEKPALLYWLIAAGHKLRLPDELAARAPVAALSVAFLVLFFFRMLREFGQRAAACASVILGTSAGWLAYSHVAVTDILLAATFSGSMLLAMPWLRSGGRRGIVWSGILLGLAVLAKGLVALVLVIPLLWLGRRRWTDLLAMGAAVIGVAAPWYIACYLRNGQAFIDEFFWKHHFGRFVSSELQHVQPFWFYAPVLLGLLFPWTPALVRLRGLDCREPRRQLLIGWLLFGFVFFSASTNKLPGYILPLLPAAAALMGIQLSQHTNRYLAGWCALLLTLIPFAAALLPEAVAHGLSRASLDAVRWPVVAAIAAGAAAVFRIGRASPGWGFAAATGLTAAAFVWLISATFPDLDRVASARSQWQILSGNGIPACVDDVRRSLRYSLFYYAGRELPECSGARDRNHDILDRNIGDGR
jgi:4-amino-4-deoxy-L-arabinose transferase-like glycosyltransferase